MLLSMITFLPLVGALALYFVPRVVIWRWIAVVTGALVLVL